MPGFVDRTCTCRSSQSWESVPASCSRGSTHTRILKKRNLRIPITPQRLRRNSLTRYGSRNNHCRYLFVRARASDGYRILCCASERPASIHRKDDDGSHLPPALLEETEASIEQSKRLFEKWDGADDGRLRYIFTPRFAGSCSMELMRRVGQFARERGAYVQTHLSENVDEIKWIRQLYPDCPSYAAVYDSAGLLSERCIMAHCIHLTPDEIALLSRTRTNVAFCPYSNRTLRSGTMPYAKLRDAGLTISLATDVAGGPSLSMLDQMREAIAAAGIAWSEALYLATLGERRR